MSADLTLTPAALAAYFDREAAKLNAPDLRAPLTKVAVLLERDTRDSFLGAHTPGGRPWPPLSPNTRRPPKKPQSFLSRLLRGRRPRPVGALRVTDRLFRGAAGGSGEHFREVTRDSVSIGDTVPYGVFQNEGTRTIPAREFFGMSEKTAEQVDDLIADYLGKTLF